MDKTTDVKTTNIKIDWSKIAMAIAVAVVFVMQQYHAMKLDEVKGVIVPRPEFEQRADRAMDKEVIMNEFKELNKRLEDLEKNNGS